MKTEFELQDQKGEGKIGKPLASLEWVQQFNDNGQPYFYNLTTLESKWEEPPLSEGGYWKQLWDDHHDALFYQHTVTNEMRWEFPSLLESEQYKGSPSSEGPKRQSNADKITSNSAITKDSYGSEEGGSENDAKESSEELLIKNSSSSSDSEGSDSEGSDSESSDSEISQGSVDDDTVFYVYHCVFLIQGCMFESPAAGIESILKLVVRVLVTLFFVLLAALQCFNDAALQKVKAQAVECGILIASALSLFTCIPGALIYRDFSSFEDTFELMPLYTLVGRVDPRRFWVFTHGQGAEATNVLSGSYPSDSMDDFKAYAPKRKYSKINSKGQGKKRRSKRKSRKTRTNAEDLEVGNVPNQGGFEMTRI